MILKNKLFLFISILFIMFLSGCLKGGSIDVNLEQDTHLEDTIAGGFLKPLNINYQSENSFGFELRKSLRENAILEDEYYMEGNKYYVYRWRLPDNYFNSPIIILEIRNPDFIEYKYLFGGGGIPYYNLIGDRASDLPEKREIEHSVTITSKADNARLFLFGYGSFCNSMCIIEGS